jgi:prepilin-type processing-associated H-X9-DG protein
MGSSVEGKRQGLPLREILALAMILVVAVLLGLPVVRATMHASARQACPANLKQWGTIFAMYRDEDPARKNPWPHGYETFGAASNAPGCANVDDAFEFCPDLNQIYPEYSRDVQLLVCPNRPGLRPAWRIGPVALTTPKLDSVEFGVIESEPGGRCEYKGLVTRGSSSYTYFGYEVRTSNDTDLQVSRALAEKHGLSAFGPAEIVAILEYFRIQPGQDAGQAMARRGKTIRRSSVFAELGYPYAPAGGGDLEWDIINPLHDVHGDGSGIYNPDVKIDKPYFASMAIMWDTIYQRADGTPSFTHGNPDGVNVLYMDGHVEFRTFPGEFPVSESFVNMGAVR